MSLEKEIKEFLNNAYGTTSIRADYTTNSKSYYDYLEKVTGILIFISRKIDEYDGTLEEYFERWEENLKEFPENVQKLLIEWLNDGTLENIINEEIFNNKLDTEIFRLYELITNRKMNDLGYNVKDFGAKIDRNTDDTIAIQMAIDEAYENGGGDVFIPSGYTRITDTIQIKENVKVYGNTDTTIFYDNNHKPVFSFHKRSKLKSVRISTPETHDDYKLLIDNQYAASLNAKDKSFGSKIFIEDVYVFSGVLPGKTKDVGLKLIADGSKGGGLYNIFVRNLYIHSCDKMIELETIGNGWINGNVFEDITGSGFINGVVIKKNTGSGGIDYNIFKHLIIQAGERSKDILTDTTNANTYTELEVWDLTTNTKTRMGYADNIYSNFSAKGKSKLYLTNHLKSNLYYLIGRFAGGGTSRFFKINISNGFSIDTDILMIGTKLVTRKQKGLVPLLNTQIKFFTKELENGQFEVYLQSLENMDVSIYLENYEAFAPDMFTYYSNILGTVQEVTNERNQIFSQRDGIVESGKNWYKLNDGTIHCWGTYDDTSDSFIKRDEQTNISELKGKKITFPVTFTELPRIFHTSRKSFAPLSVSFTTDNITLSNAIPTIYSNTDSIEYGQTFYWYAIGR